MLARLLSACRWDNYLVFGFLCWSTIFCSLFPSSSLLKGHGKVHLAGIFLKEVIQQSKDVLDDDTITDIIKTCNVIKNEKVQQSKRKVKGQAQKSKKTDKTEQAKVKKLHDDVFGDNDMYDDYDAIGDDYEDAFF